jgi:predicted acylesterase/phospholipase RssA
MRRLALALALSQIPGLAQGAAPTRAQRLEVRVTPPDMIFRFSPTVDIPGLPRVALVLSGGGARGLAEIGVIQRLEEVGYPLSSVTGTSAGALVGSLFASGFSGREIEEAFRRLDLGRAAMDPLIRIPGTTLEEQEDHSDTLLSAEFGRGHFTVAQSLRSGRELQRILQALLLRASYYSQGDFDRLRLPLRVLATNLETGEGRVFGQGDLSRAVRASMAIPGGFQPVIIDGQQFVDGALVENLPVGAAKTAFHPDLVLAVDISAPMERRPSSNFFSVAARSLDLVVERRQWESRAQADLLIRMDQPDVPFMDYSGILPQLVQRGRQAFDGVSAAFNARLLKAMGREAELQVSGVDVVCQGPVPQAILDLKAQFLDPPRPLREQSVLAFLQQVLIHGHAADAYAEVTGGDQPRLRILLTLFPEVRATEIQAPPSWRPRIEAGLAARLPLGSRFNPEQFGKVLSETIFGLVMDGMPLVDVRGSRFDAASGKVLVVAWEPETAALQLQSGTPAAKEITQRLLAPLLHKPLRSKGLVERLDLTEHRAHLDSLQCEALPLSDGSGAVLQLTPHEAPRHRLDLSLGYETNLGGQMGLSYRSRGLIIPDTEMEIRGAQNRLQEQVHLTFRRPLSFVSGAGLEMRTSYWSQRIEEPLLWPRPELQGGYSDSRLGVSEVALGAYARFGNLGTGLLRLEATQRSVAYTGAGIRDTENEAAAVASAEWDNYDHHTLPRQGLLLRGLFVGGQTRRGGADPQETFTQAYFRARGLQSLGEHLGLDLDVELGQGRNLPLDRWWALGGSGFVLGSVPLSYLAPVFGVVRFGVPLRVPTAMGMVLEFEPRVDEARIASYGRGLWDPASYQRSRGAGLLMRTTLVGLYYLELSYGVRSQAGPGNSLPNNKQFTVAIGTQPFDLWRRH